MSSELCPFCGKSFKRLKSHLPHCKAAKSSTTPPPRHEETTEKSSQKTSLETKGGKEVDKPKINPTLTKKTKRKLSEQIKMATETSRRKTPTDERVDLFPNLAEMSKSNKKEATVNVEKVNLNQTASKLSKSKRESNNLDESQAAPKDMNLSKKASSKNASVTVNRVKTSTKDHFLLREEETEKTSPENDAWTSKREAKITVHDVRSSLGRAKQNGRQKSTSFVDKLPPDVLKCEGTSHREAPSQIIIASLKEKQLVPVRSETLLSDLLKTERSDCVFTPRTEGLKDGLRVDRLTLGLALSSPARTLLEAEVSTAAFRTANVLKANGETQEARRERHGGFTRGVQSERGLGQVTLRELPDWLMSRWPSGPRDALQMFHSGWQWYYRRYMDVRRGGVGGVAMLLAGYCVLSYVWAFPHLKQDRWRKYH